MPKQIRSYRPLISPLLTFFFIFSLFLSNKLKWDPPYPAQNLKAYQLTKNNLDSYLRYNDNPIIEISITYNHLLQQLSIQPTLGNHGFIPQIYSNQQDLIDILVQYLVEIGAIEVTHMIDFEEINDKINAVAKMMHSIIFLIIQRIYQSRIFKKSKVSLKITSKI
ncbi:unnamed protein product [Paramecium pentaurelia]|uniref:Uncharacterized protein n=1 Tax=Paramecium pentaurelia TaxID=43138 RepID=A0A8S1SB84_9CILI|nr:unnamed protein product [Paramecium pentaurelia]